MVGVFAFHVCDDLGDSGYGGVVGDCGRGNCVDGNGDCGELGGCGDSGDCDDSA